jgi:hypothetical protein
VAYEADLWSRAANLSAAARDELLASEYARDTLRTALAAQVVQSYATLQSLDAQVVLFGQAVQAQRDSLNLQRMRFAAGDISELDIQQLDAELIDNAAQLPKLDRARGEAERALALVLGRSPRDLVEQGVVRSETPTLRASGVPQGLPSDLLLRRPDVPSSMPARATASRMPASGILVRLTVRPARISWARIASRTERVIAQTVSSVVDRGRAPSVGTRRAVLLKPTMPHRAAGIRIEPPVSEPRPMKTAPLATETAAPEDEPPGMRGTCVSTGLAGVPKCGLVPTPENANSLMFVRPSRAAPAARSRATAGQSCNAGAASASTAEPAAVTWARTSKRSLTDTGKPIKGRLATAVSAATPRASSKLVLRNARWQAGDWAIATDASSCAVALSS